MLWWGEKQGRAPWLMGICWGKAQWWQREGFCNIFQPRGIPHRLPATGSFWLAAPHVAQLQKHGRVLKDSQDQPWLGHSGSLKTFQANWVCVMGPKWPCWDLNRYLQVWSMPVYQPPSRPGCCSLSSLTSMSCFHASHPRGGEEVWLKRNLLIFFWTFFF